jgi:hypothetical protein
MNSILDLLQKGPDLPALDQKALEDALAQAMEEGERLRWSEEHEAIAHRIEQRLASPSPTEEE